MAAVAIRGTTYPVVLPKLRDPRLHLAATITSLQVLGQVAFDFRLSIAQILLCLGTCAVIEVALTFRAQHVLMWPASALLTGNGVAFVLRLPGNVHGEWWSLRGWWIYVATAGGSLLSKHVIKWRGEHVFNPSNIGLVAVFLVLGRTRVEPLDFWWGPMSWWMALALAIIVTGGFAILRRLNLLRVALGFWAAFAVGIGALALAGHAMTARWHLGPISGFHFWWVLVTSPEVLVFLFFMITDPKTAPTGPRARVVYAAVLGLLAAALIAPTTTEFAAKVALLSSLAIVCAVKAVLRVFPMRADRTRIGVAAALGAAAFAAVAAFADSSAPSLAAQPLPAGKLPPVEIEPSPGVQTALGRSTAETIAYDLLAAVPRRPAGALRIHLEAGSDQGPPIAVVQAGSSTYRLHVGADGTWALATAATPQPPAAVARSSALRGLRLVDVAAAANLDFQQGSFHYAMSREYTAMMGGGVCWLDYNGDGREDLFVVNSYSSADTGEWQAHGGLPRSALYENVGGSFRDVTARTHAGLAVQGDGCVAADLNGDNRPDLVVTTASGVDILWNRGGAFSLQALRASGWYTGAAVADVNGDGRPDVFVAGYADPNQPVPGSIAGFPTNLAGVRDLLFLNEGGGRFREVGVQAGLESSSFRHGLGAQFVDVNGDGRPDLYVANDEDPNQLYVDVPWPGGAAADPLGLGFRLEDRAVAEGVADRYAGMGIAASVVDGRIRLFVTNSRHEPSAAFEQRSAGPGFADARSQFDRALGSDFAGWGASWVDLENSGRPDLILTAGAIPVTNLATDAEPVRVLAPAARGFGDADGVLGGTFRVNGRGLAAADADNDGRMEIAVNTIGGRLVLLRPRGPSGHWLDVALSRFAPGAVVTVTAGGRTQTRTIQAGSSYLSSEDPRAHFGLGAATRANRVAVRFPWGAVVTLRDVRADRIVTAHVPPLRPASPAESPARLPGCVATRHTGSAATYWERAAVAALRMDGAAEPVQARDLLAVATAMSNAARAGDAAISFAAYRVLVWRASFGANLARTFALLERRLRALCYSPGFVETTGTSPAATGNRAAAAVIAAGRGDGSNEELRYADPAYTAPNAPLTLAQRSTAVHDADFWQPVAGQAFAAQWGRVRTFAPGAAKLRFAAAPIGDASTRSYRDAALAVLRATSARRQAVDSSPAAWAARAAGAAPRAPAADLRLYSALAGALNDAAVVTWRVKRASQAPRPISMIRYLAFNADLPLVAGLTRLSGSVDEVLRAGRWVDGASWTPLSATPPSPGGAAESAAFAYAAATVLGHSYAALAADAAASAVEQGLDVPGDVAVGRAIGRRVGRLALQQARAAG